MTNDRWALLAHSHTIIVKREVVLKSFPGGPEEFERIHEPAWQNVALYMIQTKSAKDALGVIDVLERNGLELAAEVGWIGVPYGPHVACPGITVECDGQPPDAHWWVSVARDHEPPYQLLLVFEDPSHWITPIPIDDSGRVLPSLQEPDGWLAIATKETFGAVDGWDEYLCARRGHWGFVLDVFRYQWLGAVPDDCFDGDGELLPERQDEYGGLKLPEEQDYCPVLGCAYGGFIGALVPSYGGPGVQLSDHSDGMVHLALEALRWPVSDAVGVQKALRQLAIEIGHVVRTAPDPIAARRRLI